MVDFRGGGFDWTPSTGSRFGRSGRVRVQFCGTSSWACWIYRPPRRWTAVCLGRIVIDLMSLAVTGSPAEVDSGDDGAGIFGQAVAIVERVY